jgi:hypothetical protein
MLKEHPDAPIEEATLARPLLVALPGAGYLEAAQTLKAMAEGASSRRREKGVACTWAGSRWSAQASGSPPGPAVSRRFPWASPSP